MTYHDDASYVTTIGVFVLENKIGTFGSSRISTRTCRIRHSDKASVVNFRGCFTRVVNAACAQIVQQLSIIEKKDLNFVSYFIENGISTVFVPN